MATRQGHTIRKIGQMGHVIPLLKKKGRGISSLAIALTLLACSPAAISTIGLPRPPKAPDCPVTVLPPGETPTRPVVDVGMVALQNCQDYTTGPCIKWLKEAVCKLGGEVAYLPEPHPPKNEIDAVNFRVLAAVYTVTSLGGDDGVCREPAPNEAATENCTE